MSKTMQQWIVLAKQQKQFVFFYEEKVLDLTDFVSKHPGGKKALANYLYKDITEIIFKVYPHKKQTTLGILYRYKIGTVEGKAEIKSSISSVSKLDIPREKKKVCFEKVSFDSLKQSQQKQSKEKDKRNVKSEKPKFKKSKSQQNKEKVKISIKTIESFQKQPSSSRSIKKQCSLNYIEEIDEQKPIFKIPILTVKHMNQLHQL